MFWWACLGFPCQIIYTSRSSRSSFDIYFHLWSNGTPHWEKEKRDWEIKQEKVWTKATSKATKKEATKKKPWNLLNTRKEFILQIIWLNLHPINVSRIILSLWSLPRSSLRLVLYNSTPQAFSLCLSTCHFAIRGLCSSP
jgi:hypothetical protein